MTNKIQLFDYCENKAIVMLDHANTFAKNDMIEQYTSKKCCREEYAANSRYMPRGFYCPSPVLNKIITNMRRGRLLSHLTSRSKATHRYVYDQENKLIIVETLPPLPKTKEYIVYERDKVLGYTFDSFNKINGLSEEVYEDGNIKRYFYVALTYSGNFHSSILENYHYKDGQLFEVDHIYVVPDRRALNLIGCDAVVRSTKLSAEDGDF